ncbi:MAG: L-seryl-tRNA(Sec) selenium transferase [Anaerolineae bacterium]|jgi:L-seryl-tRNA(Ser) seleniumtransferase|nr:L-seryl-tRNA(Sec) selenium transferase [Anaerolineae bacterium]MBT7189425.1 L-seryl-tRNA(Sec) selenium transferase [Anaerolineae bacterium]MBT7990383.1 L-seryl-tRNA(Sec) selenium transferase [Anaerolineae bacterium]
MTDLRSLPSVDKLLKSQTSAELVASYGRPLVLDALRTILDEIRAAYADDNTKPIPPAATLLVLAGSRLERWTQPTLYPVINATGVILHTNLGRAPLSPATIKAMESVARSYSTLEFDMSNGKRGSRLIHAESVIKRITGAEAAVVVNNNASAVMLILSALANRRRVVIARSQLIEIGGGFRIPDVMKQSGAKLVEVGTTNKVHLADYENAIGEEPIKLVMLAHRSNFKIVGFTEEPSLDEIARVSHAANIPVVDDLGSGTLLDTENYGLIHERTVQESLAAGADIVSFSGDKLLGGPQAGIIVGRADLIAKIKKHPLARAVRADKVALAGIAATLTHYLKDEAEREVPIWRMISTTPKQNKSRAQIWAKKLRQGKVIAAESTVGGGSLPGESLPTWLLALDVKKPDKFLANLRKQNPPVIARTENDKVLLDPRTVLPEQEGALLVALQNTLK